MSLNPIYVRVNNEDCDLVTWHQGTGPLIIFIPGGNGHGKQYNPLINLLSPRYTCATFDRRQMSRSLVANPHAMTYAQQASDVVAVIKSLNFDKAIIFGSSAGAIIAFQVAIDFPEIVDHRIAHEPPLFHVLPEADEVKAFMLDCLATFRAKGIDACMEKFSTIFRGFDEGVPDSVSPEPGNNINQWTYEIPCMLEDELDVSPLKQNGTSVGLMVGKRSAEAVYARASTYIQRILGCVWLKVPGHHEGFQVESEEFLGSFNEMIGILEGNRRLGENRGIPEIEF